MQTRLLGALMLLCFVSLAAAQSPRWRAGRDYHRIEPPQPTHVPAGKVEVTEVFSWGCPACNQFYPMMDRLRASLPPVAEVDYVAAAFHPGEDWRVFQRAYYAAHALGVAAKTHDAVFDAVWKTGELETVDPQTHRLRNPLPSIEHCQVSETPTIIVNGRYRVSPSSAGSYSRMAEIVKWLVAKCAKR